MIRGRRSGGWLFTGVVALGFTVLVALPLALVLGQAVVPNLLDGSGLRFSVAPLLHSFSNARSLTAIAHTVSLSAVASASACLMGFAHALLLKRTDIPGRRLLGMTPWLVFVTPGYLKALAWVLLMSPGGYLEQLGVLPEGGGEAFFGLPGLVFVHTLSLFPLASFVMTSAMAGLGGEFEDAARTVGAGAGMAWWRINLPLLGPAMALAFLAIFAEVASDFGLASTIARSANFGLLTYSIYTAIESYPVDFPLAGSQAMVLLVILGSVLLLDRLLRRQRSVRLISGRSRPARVYRLGLLRVPAGLALLLVSVLAVYLPLAAIAVRAVARTLGRGIDASNLTWRWVDQALSSGQEANFALVRSLEFAGLTAVIAGVLALVLAWRLDQGARLLRDLVLACAMGAIAIPGVVMGLGYILMWDRLPPFVALDLYGKWPLLVLGYVSAALPYALVIVLGAVGQIAPSLMDAARLHGAGSMTRLLRIVVPLIATSLITAVLFVFVRTVFELPMSQLLQPTSGAAAPSVIVRLFGNDDDGLGSALSLLAILATGGIAGLGWLAGRSLCRRYWRNGFDSLGSVPGNR